MRIRQHDTLPLQVQLRWNDGSVIDLSEATSVAFIMRLVGSLEISVNNNCVIVDRVNGIVKYEWDTNETSVIGMYDIVWEILWNNDVKQTVPNDADSYLWIIGDLDSN